MTTGYKQTEIGVIPEDWDVKPLGKIGEALIGLTYKPAEVRDHGTLVLRSSNIQNDALSFDDNVFVDADIPERIMVRPGDVLICVRNGSRDLIGKSALLDERAKGMTFGAFMAVYRSPIGTLASYLFQSAVLKRQINEHLGATINQITNKSLNSFRIPVPPSVPEQRAIAEALSDADALIESLEQFIAKKRHIKQGAMQELLAGKKRLPGFGGEWEVVKAGDIGRFRGGSGFPTKFQGASSGAYPFFKVSDMNNEGNETFMEAANNYISEALRKQLGATAFPAKSIVFAKVGAAVFLERKKILAKASCLDNNMAAFVLDSGRADCRYIHYVLLNKKMSDLVSTTALPSLSGSVLAAIELMLPPLPEQTAIAAILSDMDAEIAALETKLAKARQIKQGMMQELLTGGIRLV
ncbi:MAG: restriction endonuclease subunit S [Candidatus Contendobacter sp.]